MSDCLNVCLLLCTSCCSGFVSNLQFLLLLRFVLLLFCVVFFFKQKTAYELRISDWSSDVCSSDLPSLSSSPRRHREGRISEARTGTRARQDARRPSLPGTGDARCDRMRGLHAV